MQNSETEINKLRTQIDQIHLDLGRLFQQRLQLNLKIWHVKKQCQLPLLDSKREAEIVHRFDTEAKNENEKIALQNFFKTILIESKNYTGKQLK